jgi:hypothetical protein
MGVDGTLSTNSLEGMFPGLNRQRQFSDLVQEDRAAICDFELKAAWVPSKAWVAHERILSACSMSGAAESPNMGVIAAAGKGEKMRQNQDRR